MYFWSVNLGPRSAGFEFKSWPRQEQMHVCVVKKGIYLSVDHRNMPELFAEKGSDTGSLHAFK